MSTPTTNQTTDKPAALSDLGVFNADIPGAGLVLDLNANILSSIVQTGEKISSWTDQKNSLVAAQATVASQPTLDLDGIRFSGSTFLDIPAFAGLNLTASMSIFVVGTPDDVVTNAYSRIIEHTTGANGYAFGYGASTPNGVSVLSFLGISALNPGVTSWVSGARSVMGVTYGSLNMKYRKNSHSLGTTKVPPGNAISINTITRIGTEGSGPFGWVGTIKRILIYSTELSGTNLQTVEQGLVSEGSF